MCDPGYGWLTRVFGFNETIRSWIVLALVGLSIFLGTNVVYYFTAKYTGVDIDPSLLYESDSERFKDIESAVASNDPNVKLNTLLRGRLENFINASDALVKGQRRITGATVAIVVLGILLGFLTVYARTFPRAFFSIGLAKEHLRKLERRRDWLATGVFVAILINLGTGIAVALMF